ncbi:hypothetical protein SNEBB_001491 [Seison nebaliae]|nr:hypothetical protein SNEBB_001491 [Seison nebaliae]
MNSAPMMNSYQKPMNVQPVRPLMQYGQSQNQAPLLNDFQQSSNICAGKQINERFPHPTNEGMYIECGFDGQKFERLCPPKTKYVEKYGQCTLGFPLDKPCSRVEHACKNGGVCENVNNNEYMCKCKPGFTGLDCSLNVDDCASNPCGSDLCLDLIGGHICMRSLPDGTTLIGESPNQMYKSECQITDEPNQFFSTQFNPSFYYQCTPQGLPVPKSCHVGYNFHLNERACLDKPIDQECVALGCNLNQVCIKDPMARCECKEGYTGQFCEMKIDYCSKNPCKNGGVCTSYSTGYTCLCPSNFYDDDCMNVQIQNPCRVNEMANGIHIYAHPKDNTKFISCFAYEAASVLSCPPGMTFDAEIRTCLSNEYQQAIANVLEQQKYQATLPKTWKPSGDPLRMPSIVSGSAKLVPYDTTKKQFQQQSQQVFIQPAMPINQIQPMMPAQQSWSSQKMMDVQKPLVIQQSYQQKQQVPKMQQSSWSSSYQSSKVIEEKPQLFNSAPVKFNGGY